MTDLRKLGEEAARQGRNISQTLREHLGVDHNTPEVIKVTYDLQAGDYVRFAEQHQDYMAANGRQLASLLDQHLHAGDTLLDAGAGELTTLTHILEALRTKIAHVIAVDISQARLDAGLRYAAARNTPLIETIKAEIANIPLANGAADIVTTNHALEPNRGRERELLTELLRLAKRKLVLFEPCYELASAEAKARMDSHGYVRALGHHAEALGATIESITPLPLVWNPLNPTACYVISH